MGPAPNLRRREVPSLRDDALSAELHQFDPYDIMGYGAFVAASSNIVASILGEDFAYEMLLSASLVLGLLSFFNWGGLLGKAALVLMAAHIIALHIVRIFGLS